METVDLDPELVSLMASAPSFLLSDDGSWVSGQIILIMLGYG